MSLKIACCNEVTTFGIREYRKSNHGERTAEASSNVVLQKDQRLPTLSMRACFVTLQFPQMRIHLENTRYWHLGPVRESCLTFAAELEPRAA